MHWGHATNRSILTLNNEPLTHTALILLINNTVIIIIITTTTTTIIIKIQNVLSRVDTWQDPRDGSRLQSQTDFHLYLH